MTWLVTSEMAPLAAIAVARNCSVLPLAIVGEAGVTPIATGTTAPELLVPEEPEVEPELKAEVPLDEEE